MSLFRKEAVRQYMDPDARGGVLRVSPPSGLRLFAALAALFLLALYLAATQTVHVTAAGRGVVRPSRGVRLLRAEQAGRVTEVHVEVGARVALGAPLVTLALVREASAADDGPLADLLAKQRAEQEVLRAAGEEELARLLAKSSADLEEALSRSRARAGADASASLVVTAPLTGNVDAVLVRAGELIDAGAVVAKVVPEGDALVGWMVIEGKHRAHLAPGRKVRLRLDEHPSEEAGFGLATLGRTSRDPVDADALDPLLAHLLVDARAPFYLVELQLDAMPPRARGAFENGMTFRAEVVLREQRVLAILFPSLGRLFDSSAPVP